MIEMENEEFCTTQNVIIERGKEDIPGLGCRIVTRASTTFDGVKVVGIAYHWPGDPFDAEVGEQLAMARMYKDAAKHLKECSYTTMLLNIAEHREQIRENKAARNSRKFFQSEEKRARHNARLFQALSDCRVFYCQSCEEYFGALPVGGSATCPHCGQYWPRETWMVHRRKHMVNLREKGITGAV